MSRFVRNAAFYIFHTTRAETGIAPYHDNVAVCILCVMFSARCRKSKGLVSAIVKPSLWLKTRMKQKQLRSVVELLSPRFPKAMEVVERAEDEILAYMDFPIKHWQSIFSTNLLERLNKEIRRRFNVVSVFPDRNSVVRLGGSILMEQHDEWAAADRRYMSAESMTELYVKIALDSTGTSNKLLA